MISYQRKSKRIIEGKELIIRLEKLFNKNRSQKMKTVFLKLI